MNITMSASLEQMRLSVPPRLWFGQNEADFLAACHTEALWYTPTINFIFECRNYLPLHPEEIVSHLEIPWEWLITSPYIDDGHQINLHGQIQGILQTEECVTMYENRRLLFVYANIIILACFDDDWEPVLHSAVSQSHLITTWEQVLSIAVKYGFVLE
jgi:hypothetical protein